MTSKQQNLGGIAEELAESQREISIAEFFEKNKQMLGFGSHSRGLVTAIKEAVDNALDATEEINVKPEIHVEVQEHDDYYTVIVEDNGPGITKDKIPKVFGKLLYGSRFHKLEQHRGQQGIGISAAVLHSQMTSGNPARVTSRSKGLPTSQYYELTIDTESNEPNIRTEKEVEWDKEHGTRIELDMAANLRARKQLHRYIKHTATVNPHARLTFTEPRMDGVEVYERDVEADLPTETEEIQPHPHGIQFGTLRQMLEQTDSYSISGFLQEEFTRVGNKSANDILNTFRDLHHGKEIAWDYHEPTTEDENTLERTIKLAVVNKAREEVETFGNTVAEEIKTQSPVTYTDIENIVHNTAEHVENKYDTRFGSTVRDKTTKAAWNYVTQTRYTDFRTIVDNATSKRKNGGVIDVMAEELLVQFINSATSTDEFDEEYTVHDVDQTAHAFTKDRVTPKQLSKLIETAAKNTSNRTDKSFGDTAQNNIQEALENRMQTVEDDIPKLRKFTNNRKMAQTLAEAMQTTNLMAPPSKCLSPIGETNIERGLRKEFNADFYASATRGADVHSGDPFIAEAGIAYGGDLQKDQAEILRFANRVPLVYARGGCATTKVVKRINWKNYNLNQPGGNGIPSDSVIIMVHIASTNVPFTSESKDAVADVDVIKDEVEGALRQAARKLKSYLNEQQKRKQKREKQNTITEILPEMAAKLGNITGKPTANIDASLAGIMNNVLVNREQNGDEITLTIHNFDNTSTDEFTIKEHLDTSPSNVSTNADVIRAENGYLLKWTGSISAGEQEEITYTIDSTATVNTNVEGIIDEKLTANI